MRRLGLIGGTSWHSTAEYYRLINQSVNSHFGDNTNPPLILYNLNQSMIHRFQVENNWDAIADEIVDGGVRLEAAGVEAVLICANTPHKVFDHIEEKLTVPVLHIADATATEIRSQGITKVCFLGTRYTMEQPYITDRIGSQGIEVIVPEELSIIVELHRIIQQELTYGRIHESSKKFVLKVIHSMIDLGAKAVVLGCTEFPLMIQQKDLKIPIFDTTKIHAFAAVNFVLSS